MMTVHRPDPQCNINTAATATIPASVREANDSIIARREARARERAKEPDQARQHPEPKPTLDAAQILHDFASTLQDSTGSSQPQKPKPLSVKKPPLPATAEESIVAQMIGSGNGAQRAVVKALAFAMKHRHGIQTCEYGGGFNTDEEWEPGEGNARALTFTRTLLHAPTFAGCRGDGIAFVRRLATVLGAEGLDLLAVKLGCETEDLVLAADRVRTLIGETLLSVAALGMDRVVIPPHVLVHIRHFPNVLGVVKLVAALAEVHGKRDGVAFVSLNDAASVIGSQHGSISRAFSIAVRLGALELVSRGGRKHANAPGVASVYRVAWVVPKVS